MQVRVDRWWNDADRVKVSVERWWDDTDRGKVSVQRWWDDTDRGKVGVERWWNDTDRGKPKYWDKNLFQCHCVHSTLLALFMLCLLNRRLY
jgi:hypothetical protein